MLRWTFMYKSLCGYFHFLGWMLRVELLGHSKCIFKKLPKWLCHIHQQCTFAVSLYLCKHMVLPVAITAGLVGVVYLKMIFICISLMTIDIRHAFNDLIRHSYILLVKCLFRTFAPFLNWDVYLILSYKCSLFWNTPSVSDI